MSNGTLKVDDGRSWSFLTSNILRLQHRFGEHSLGGLLGQEWYERHSRTSHVEMYDQLIAGERNVGGFAKQGRKNDAGVVPTGTESDAGSFSVFSEINYIWLPYPSVPTVRLILEKIGQVVRDRASLRQSPFCHRDRPVGIRMSAEPSHSRVQSHTDNSGSVPITSNGQYIFAGCRS